MGPEEIQRFHDDLAAAVEANVPLEISESGSSPTPLTSQLVSQLRHDLETSNELPKRFQAALTVFEHLDLMSPVLDGFSTRSIARRESNNALSWTWRYLGLIILTALIGLYLYAEAVSPVVAELRADSQATASESPLEPAHFLPTWPQWLPYFSAVFGLLFVWAIAGGTHRWTQWVGGHNYGQLRMKKSATETIRMLLAVNVSWEQAVELGCCLSGMDSTSRKEIQQLNQDDLTKNLAQTDQLAYLSNQALVTLKTTTPILVISIVGSVIGLLYCSLIFHPITSMLNEIGGVGL